MHCGLRDRIFRCVRETHLYFSGDTNSQSVVNHNSLPDIAHEEFVSLLGPLLVQSEQAVVHHVSC